MVIFSKRLSCLARLRSELSIIVIRSPSTSEKTDGYATSKLMVVINWNKTLSLDIQDIPSSAYFSVTSSVLLSLSLKTRCSMRISSSYVMSSL